MKIQTVMLIAVLGTAGVSCSKCYDCTRQIPIEVDQDGDGVKEVVMVDDTEEVCTANRSEVDSKESEGYSCSS